jgi:hypothetical protein
MTNRSGLMPWLVVLGVLASCGGITQPLGDVEGKGGVGGDIRNAGGSNAGKTSVGGGSVMPQGGTTLLPQSTDPYVEESCYSACAEQILRATVGCKLCHGTAVKLAGDLDLESLGRIKRLKDVPAQHPGLRVGQEECPQGDKLIDSVNVNQSWMLKKIRGQQGNCGEQDPLGTHLSETELACLTSYIECIAGLDEVR